jgi:hypothetical protein
MIGRCKALYGAAAPAPKNEETTMSIVTLAKRIVEEGAQAHPSVSKAMLYTEMTKRADATRRADETSEGAFARFATTDADGRALFAAYKLARGEDYRPTSSMGVVSASPRPEERPIPPPNAAHDALMRKAEALVAKVAKSGIDRPLTVEQAFEKVFSDPDNRALARSAVRPASMSGAASADQDQDEDDTQASYEDDGGNTAHNPRNAVIGRLERDSARIGRPTSAPRSLGLTGRTAKIKRRVEKFLTMCPASTDEEALGYALAPKRVRKAYEVRLRVG